MDYQSFYRTSGLAAVVRRRNFLRIAATLLAVALIVLGLALAVPRYAKLETETNPAFWFFLIAVSLLPIAIFKPLKVFDRTWGGVIHRIKEDEEVTNDTKGTRKLEFTVIQENGDVSIVVYKGKQADIADNYYKEGNRVIHFSGTVFLYNLDSPSEEKLCLFCGHTTTDPLCPRCRNPVPEICDRTMN